MGILVNDGNSKPVNLSAYAVAMPVAKHGSHDQASHGSWAGNGAPGAAGSGENAAEGKTNSGGNKTKNDIYAKNRKNEKISNVSSKLDILSEKVRSRAEHPYWKKQHLAAADELKNIASKFKLATGEDVSDASHHKLVEQAGNALRKFQVSPKYYMPEGTNGSFRSIEQEVQKYIIEVQEDIYYMNKALSEKEE